MPKAVYLSLLRARNVNLQHFLFRHAHPGHEREKSGAELRACSFPDEFWNRMLNLREAEAAVDVRAAVYGVNTFCDECKRAILSPSRQKNLRSYWLWCCAQKIES